MDRDDMFRVLASIDKVMLGVLMGIGCFVPLIVGLIFNFIVAFFLASCFYVSVAIVLFKNIADAYCGIKQTERVKKNVEDDVEDHYLVRDDMFI